LPFSISASSDKTWPGYLASAAFNQVSTAPLCADAENAGALINKAAKANEIFFILILHDD